MSLDTKATNAPAVKDDDRTHLTPPRYPRAASQPVHHAPLPVSEWQLLVRRAYLQSNVLLQKSALPPMDTPPTAHKFLVVVTAVVDHRDEYAGLSRLSKPVRRRVSSGQHSSFSRRYTRTSGT